MLLLEVEWINNHTWRIQTIIAFFGYMMDNLVRRDVQPPLLKLTFEDNAFIELQYKVSEYNIWQWIVWYCVPNILKLDIERQNDMSFINCMSLQQILDIPSGDTVRAKYLIKKKARLYKYNKTGRSRLQIWTKYYKGQLGYRAFRSLFHCLHIVSNFFHIIVFEIM